MGLGLEEKREGKGGNRQGMVTHPEEEDEAGLSGGSTNRTAAKQGGPGRLRSATGRGTPSVSEVETEALR